MSSSQQAFQKFLDLQRVDYLIALPGKVAELQALWRTTEGGVTAPSRWIELERLAHTLAGTAGTLGFGELGRAARSLELLLAQTVTPAQTKGPSVVLTPAHRSAISLAIAAMQASLPAD